MNIIVYRYYSYYDMNNNKQIIKINSAIQHSQSVRILINNSDERCKNHHQSRKQQRNMSTGSADDRTNLDLAIHPFPTSLTDATIATTTSPVISKTN